MGLKEDMSTEQLVRAEQVKRAMTTTCPACHSEPHEPCYMIERGLNTGIPLRYPHRDRLTPWKETELAISNEKKV